MRSSWLRRHCIGKFNYTIPKPPTARWITSSRADQHHFTTATSLWSSSFAITRRPCRHLPPHSSWRKTSSDKKSSSTRSSISHSVVPFHAEKTVNHNLFRVSLEDEHQTLEEVLELANTHIHVMTPSDMAAVWSRIPRALPKHYRKYKKPTSGDLTQIESDVRNLLEITTNSVATFQRKELATIILGVSRVIHDILEAHQQKRMNLYQRALCNVFLNDENDLQFQLNSILQPFVTRADEILGEFQPRDLSNLAYSLALIGYDDVTKNLTDDRGGCNSSSMLLENIADASIGCMDQFSARGICNLVWAFAKLNVSHHQLFQSAGDAVVGMDTLDNFRPEDLSNMVWAFAAAHIEHLGLFHKVGDEIGRRDLASFNPQELTIIVSAYASANVQHLGLFQSIGDAIVSLDNLRSIDPRGIHDIVGAYATVNTQHPAMFERIGNDMVARQYLKYFNLQTLSNIVWAYATVNAPHSNLFKKIGDMLSANDDLNSFNSRDMSNTVWAYASTNERHPALFQKLGDIVTAKDDLTSYQPRELSNTVWAYASANVQHPILFEKVSEVVMKKDDLIIFQPQELSNILWAYATAKVYHPDLFKHVGNKIAAKYDLESFEPQHISMTVWAYATANEHHVALFEKIQDHIIQNHGFNSFTTRNLTDFAWAYTALNIDLSPLINTMLREQLIHCQNEFIEEGEQSLQELYAWHLWQTKENDNDGLPTSLRDRCKQAFLSVDPPSSRLKTDVLSHLNSMGMNPIENHRTPTGYTLDALVEINGKTIGVEVYGPSHCIGYHHSGSTQLKQRQICTIDEIVVVSVPYWEWNKFGKDRSKKQTYLQSLFDSV